MSTIIVIESRPLVRRGIVQLVSETIPDSCIDAVASWDMPGNTEIKSTGAATPQQHTDYVLMLLSVEMVEETTHQTVAAARERYHPKSILLLSEGLAPWPQDFPSYVIGCVPLHAPTELLQASIRLALTDDEPLISALPSFDTSARGEELLLPQNAITESMRNADPAELAPPIAFVDDKESKALGLTPRQYEVLVLLARGYTLKTIARHLSIAAATAKVHAETVYQRLHVHNRTEAIYAAISRGATLGWSNITREIPAITSTNVVAIKRSG
ncbi:HTH luxR-type domain-containing protein [Bordetella tumbae]|uniref:response regulator transcription factor n=1 Tax=Bordetella tumbae TaxID=1649139 RepID=UPI0039EE0B22